MPGVSTVVAASFRVMSILAKRLRAQLLAGGKADAPLPVVERLLAIQAQDARGARLAIRARSAGLRAADVDTALTADRSLVITWLNRGTLHLVRSDDYPWLQQLTAPQLRTATARRLSQEGVTPDAAERGVAAIERALAEDGPLERDRLRERVAAASVRTHGQAFVHLLALASIRGLIVRGPMLGGRQAFVLVRDWLGEAGPIDRDRALAELARRYLAGHGPATAADLGKWAGLPLRDARLGLQAIASELHQDEGDLVDLKRRATTARLPDPQLLGSFEPVLLGWTNRDEILGEDAARVVSGGVFRAFALVRGRAAATWTISRGAVKLEPFRPLSSADRSALETEAADVTRYLQERE
ncbi:MAG TPA: winged helix DNA-binding domain-containing protein [Gaiellales bacterium]|nr:winged helix DNA-binding domain-containing protein [Gaiellales bacterium]